MILRRLAIQVFILQTLAVPLAAVSRAAAETPPMPAAGAALGALTAEMTAANYAADIDAMTRLAASARRLAEEGAPADRWLAHHQAGVAEWFLAGFVGPGSLAHPMGDLPRMVGHLETAARSFEAAILLAPDFADAHAALANCYGFLAFLAPKGTPEEIAAQQQLAVKARTARERSLELGARSARTVVVDAGFLFWAPPAVGGDRPRGLARYREALELFAVEPAAERARHCWGEPDAWAFLAGAYLALEPSDPIAAKAAIEHALALRPDFAWARGALLPRVTTALDRHTDAGGPSTGGSARTTTTSQKP